jgi:electron transfer flavoprotein beta subunit
MRIAVCLKYVPDPATIEVDPLTGAIDSVRTLYMLNPADRAALEMALRLRPKTGTVQALTVGPPEAEAVLRDALAVGADSVLRLWDDSHEYTKPHITSLLLATALQLEELPDLILLGSRSVDRGSGKIPALLAEHLNYPVATDVTFFEIEEQSVLIQRRLSRGARAEGEMTLPAVLGLEEGVAQLRYASLPGLIAAQQATIPVHDLAGLGLSPSDLNFPTVTLSEVMPPRPRARAIFMPDSKLPPHERVAQIMSAGVASKSGQVLENGSPEEMADAIIEFLQQRGFLEPTS